MFLAAAILPLTMLQARTTIPRASQEDRAASAGWTRGGAWIDQHEDIKKIGLSHQVDLVLLGDSITQGWAGPGRNVWQAAPKDVWERHLAHRNAASFGISGDGTEHILWRIDNGAFDNIDPKVVSLMIGVNNTPRDSSVNIAAGITAIVKRIRTKLPNAKILLQSPIPAGKTKDDEYRVKLDRVTETIQALHDGDKIHFLDTREAFTTPDGLAREDLMAGDFIHLKPAGYRAWAEAMESKLAELMDKDLTEKAVSVLPHERQMAWQELDFTCFIHFGVNTFTGREWGTGKEDPAIFNPVDFDADQWVLAAKSAGMKLMMLVAKHHDGFCMWPSPYTDHDVESSPWQGDIVKEITEACRRHGLKFGFYLSPADLYQIENEKGVYGKNSEYVESVIPTPEPGAPQGPRTFRYTVDDYNRYFLNQLYELLTQYGEITEVWFDGANPKPGTGQEYNYADWYEMIHELQPGANIAIAGPDVRWCGNEAGRTRRSEWSVVPATVNEDGTWKGAGATLDDLGSLGMLSKFEDMRWHPAETNTSIRHGWFWRDEKQYVKTTREILDVWTRSVGGNTVFLLNLTPNDRGLIPERDLAVLKAVGENLRETYGTDLTEGAEASSPGLLDGNSETGWQAAQWVTSADVEIELDGEKTFNRVLLQEPIATSGQRVSKFYVDAKVGGEWKQIGEGTTIGFKRILVTDTVTADAVRIRIRGARVTAQLSTVSLHLAPVILTTPRLARSRGGQLTMVCDPTGPAIHYTLDGSTPTAESAKYEGAIELADGGHVRAVAVHPTTGEVSSEVSEVYGMATAGWKIASFTSEQADANEQATNAIDGNPGTIWHSQWKGDVPEHPHSIVIDMGAAKSIAGFTYLPRSNSLAGVFKKWKVEVSADGSTFTPAGEGEFGNIKNNPIQQIVRFDQAVTGRFVKVTCLESVDNAKWASAAEIGLLGK